MRLREVFRYEVEYRFRSAATWVYAGILFLIAIWMFLATADEGPGAYFNSPTRLAGGFMMVGIFGTLVTAAIFGEAAVRDFQAGMDPLLFTSPLRKAEYLGGRFLGSLAVNAVLVVAIPLGLFASTRVAASFETVGPFRLVAYLQPFLLLSLPNLAVTGAILFTIGMLARHVVPVYLGAIGLFIGYVVVLNYAPEIDNPILAALADPTGIGAVQELTRYWTEAEQNTRLVGFPAMLFWNRIAWLAVAAAVPVLFLGRFRFAHADGEARQRKARRVIVDPAPERPLPVMVPRVAGAFGPRTMARQTLAVARTSLEEIAGGRAFAVTLLVVMGLTLLWGWNVADTAFDTSVWPVTHLVGGVALSVRNTPIIYLLIAVYAGELVWKDREVRVAEIADAAPVPEGVELLGRFLSLVAILTTFQVVFMAAGVVLQAAQGYYNFELGLYLRLLFGVNLSGYVLLGALAMTIHVILNHKYLGHLVFLLAIASTAALPALGIIRHHLLLYGTGPGWTYSDMNGFGPFVAPLVWFKMYWAAWALLLAVVATLFWVRGREPGLRRRLEVARARLIGPTARAAGVGIVLILLLGGFIFYNTNVLNEYSPGDQAGLPQAEYEKRYKRFDGAPQPNIIGADLRVEIYPENRSADLRGTYRLVNRAGVAIDSVHVYTVPDVQVRSISFDRASRPVVTDQETGYQIHALERALQPGDSLQLAFDVRYHPRGFPNSGIPTEVVNNGTHFDRRKLPFIGYQSLFEIPDDLGRKHFGLGPRAPMPGPGGAEGGQGRNIVQGEDRVRVTTVIGTAADQTAITPGALRGSWTDPSAGSGGRRYFQYESEPTLFGGTVYSGRYAVLEDRWTPSTGSGQAVDLRIYHHPDHTYVLDRTLRSMKASLEYYTEQFSPYPDTQLRIVEFPRYGGFGVAHLHMIGFSEDNFISRVKKGEIDQPFYGTAHEIAHQWWPGQVMGAMVRGHSFLSESLANYSAMMVMEKIFGPEVARRVYDFQMERYLVGRATQSREVPVLEVEDQPYIAYRKGAIAMYTLREHIGEELVNTALRRYLEKYRDAGPPYPTSLDLYAELRAVTPDSLQSLLRDLFEEVTLWEVKAERAHVEPSATGEYVLTINVVAKKMRADSVGNETPVPMNDLVEIGVFAPGDGDGLGAPLYLKQHRIRSGRQTITVTVPREPARAGIDPYRKLIDRQRDDNVVEVARAGPDTTVEINR
jgi:ABC-type transport system involved in multi-copper enzyme maturation permease subunit